MRSPIAGRGLALVALLLGGVSCPHNASTQASRAGTVILTPAGRTIRVEVEIVRTPEERAQGLMHRRELAALHGMLFIFEQEEAQSFWMKNTYLALDMIFIDGRRRVVGVVENAEPMTTTSRRVETPSRFVLEVNAGFARRWGIGAGTAVRLEGVD